MDGVIIIFHSLMIMPASLFFHRDEIKWCNDGFRLAAFQAKVIKYKFNIFVVRNCNWQDNWSIRHSNLCFMTIYTILWQFLTIFLSLLRHQVFKWLPLSVRWSVVQQRRFSSPNSWLCLNSPDFADLNIFSFACVVGTYYLVANRSYESH